jgi:flagellar basal-body rod protein FlgC
MRPRVQQPYWRSPFLPQFLDNGPGKGVRVAEIQKDDSPPRKVYDPTHPDRILEGPDKDYVLMPNVDIVTEMVDLIEANRMYEANAQVVEGYKSMFQRALEIGRG